MRHIKPINAKPLQGLRKIQINLSPLSAGIFYILIAISPEICYNLRKQPTEVKNVQAK